MQGDSDDDGEPNTYDYNDSFIDDEDTGKSDPSSLMEVARFHEGLA